MGTEIRDFGPIEYEGFNLSGQYEYTPEVAATQDTPGDAAQINIVDIRIKGVDRNALDLFDDGVLKVLEERISNGLPAVVDADHYDDYQPEFEEAA